MTLDEENLARMTHVYQISAQNFFVLHCEEKRRNGTLILGRHRPNIHRAISQAPPGAAGDPNLRRRRQRWPPGSMMTMESDAPYQVKFVGQCSAHGFEVTDSNRRKIFSLRRYPNEDYYSFFMNRAAQIFFVTDRDEGYPVELEREYEGGGYPEVFGYHLLDDVLYNIATCEAVTVNTHTAARINIFGKPRFISVTPSRIRRQLQALLDHIEFMRLDASNKGTLGPRVLVVGPARTGKTSLCHLFLNEAAEIHEKPVFVDINVSSNSNTVPGAISLLKVEEERDLTEGFPGVPRVLPFGYFSTSEKQPLYILILQKVREILESMLDEDVNARNAGVIIDACEIVELHEVLYLIDMFAINTVVVTTSIRDPLYGPLLNLVHGTVNVIYLPPEETGAVRYHNWDISDLRWRKFFEYFYGTRGIPRTVTKLSVSFDEVWIYSIIVRPDRVVDLNNVTLANFQADRVHPTAHLLDRAMAVSATNRGDQRIAIAGAHYFVYLFSIEEGQRRLFFLSPNLRSLSGATLWIMEGFFVGGLPIRERRPF